MYNHQDLLNPLNKNISLNEKLKVIHENIRQHFAFIERVSVAIYDPKTDLLKTFINSSGDANPLRFYEAKLSEVISLQEVLQAGQPRIINDLAVYDRSTHEHAQKIRAQGYGSSYTMPIYLNNNFGGFIFFNSSQKDCFVETVVSILDIFGHLISSIVTSEIGTIKIMLAALKTANEMVHYKDPETGNHLQRMSRFARLIAQELAISGKYHLNDQFIEQIFLFAPLHDVGKIGIKDDILLKTSQLNEKEFEVMKTHTIKGRQIIDAIIENFGLESFEGVNILRNIAESHHETLDGLGYPHGLKDGEIPLEAQIVAVADIFDALTSQRSYKMAWTNEEAFAMLERLSQTKLDKDCVAALIKNHEKVREIQASFQPERES